MQHLPQLIVDLALIMITAGLTGLLFKWLKQPVVLGYLLAGLLVGPNFPLIPDVADRDSIQGWAELGVIFLLFSLGLEFSFKRLMRSGGAVVLTGIIGVGCMFALGYFTGGLLGWSGMDRLFLGGIISISSTTIILRTFSELGFKNRRFAGHVVGVLIIEDVVAVILLVLLSTISLSAQFSGTDMILTILKLCFFLVLWFLAGIFLLPTFLRLIRKWLNDESLLIISLGLCFLMVVLASQAGFSAAFGAFIMGSILAETPLAERIEHLLSSIKDLFGAIFFVSVGMLIDPKLLLEYWAPVVILILAVGIGKPLFVSLGSLVSGISLRQSLLAGFSMGQIGEFSFIIATLGLSLGVISDKLYPIAVGVSAVTTFATPYLMKAGEPMLGWLERILPRRMQDYLDQYAAGAQQLEAESDWKKLLKAYAMVLLVNGVIITALILAVRIWFLPWYQPGSEDGMGLRIGLFLLVFALMAPFLWAIGMRRFGKIPYTNLWMDKDYNRGPLVLLEISRVLVVIFFIGLLARQFFSTGIAFGLAIVATAIFFYLFNSRLQKFYDRLEQRFIRNFHEKEEQESRASGKGLSPWDAHLANFDVDPDFTGIGHRLEQLELREKYGVNIALINRRGKIIYAPNKDERLFPGDKIAVIGTDEQLASFKTGLDEHVVFPAIDNAEDVELIHFEVEAGSSLVGRSIRESGIRESTRGLIVGIERNGERLLNPKSDMRFQVGDMIWMVGQPSSIHLFRKSLT